MNHSPFSTRVLTYADVRDCKFHAVTMSYRDLKIIADVLDLYARQLREHMEETPPKNFWAENNNTELMNRIKRISDRLADAIGLDKTYTRYKKFLERMRRSHDDIGGEALYLTVARGRQKKTDGKDTETKNEIPKNL